MRMIMVLDKLCLTVIVLLSIGVGYKTGVAATELKYSLKDKEEKVE